jgi:hydroxymethylbilane synthase
VPSPSGERVKLRIGTRGSALARWQAQHLTDRLQALHPELDVQPIIVQTTGDRITDVPLARIGERGLFTKEIDRALLDDEIDLAIHSLKDVPTRLADGLAIGAVLEREDARDALVCAPGVPASLELLSAGARIGTSSLRRRSQLLHRRPDLAVEDLRGNLDTRLRRVQQRDFDAIILAAAGLKRLGFADAISELLDPPGWLSAVGQGALAVACRADDSTTLELLARLDHAATRAATAAERAFLRELEGGCQVPIGALAATVAGGLRLEGFVASLDGADFLRGDLTTAEGKAEEAGRRLAATLIDAGANTILEAVRRQAAEEDIPHPSAP